MANSAQSIKDKLMNISKEKHIKFNLVMRFYMYDRFIERLSKSQYNNNFILKGGFYLSKIFGIENRSTMDIDTSIRKTNLTENNIKKMIEEIINIDVSDDVKFKIDKLEPIRDEDEYGGIRATLIFKLENIKDRFHIDIASGDPIYPGPHIYYYKSLIDDETYKMWSYSMETILAEKIETILSKAQKTSRMKDYYDVYLISKSNKIDKNKFQKATEKTFKKRKFKLNPKDQLKKIKQNKELIERWKSYTRKNEYAKDIEFKDTIESIEKVIEML